MYVIKAISDSQECVRLYISMGVIWAQEITLVMIYSHNTLASMKLFFIKQFKGHACK